MSSSEGTALGGERPVSGYGTSRALRIGEAAGRADVSPRTLRWYEELGLLIPSGHTAGGARRYSEGDMARIAHIRELQSLLGFDLVEIGAILRAEDELAGLRVEYRSGAGLTRRRAILQQAISLNETLRAMVTGKQARLTELLAKLAAKEARYQALLDDLDGST